ncbi:hypothetical protein QBC34DRAFT_390846 [Podospora aff. communis PSN243]|uniref:LPXTG-domain-containing protein n=1 Tax=Podospora aff. communis PSN243 TaxID=3040156 RepID=A0AAV9H8F0_9PEZI|nr:hypothetical protein QBC34DRAFT_390846 [Podospora aff. communis PSN243]
MAPPRIAQALLAIVAAAGLGSALQVTPNSPCAQICQDQPQFDVSAPASSNTKNSDMFCEDADHHGAEGSKWKDCMTCLQTSDFYQGEESDQMWFLFNLRYSISYCIFAYPNATGVDSTPCVTNMACGPLQEGFQDGLLDQRGMTPYGYCTVGGGGAKDVPTYERCVSCVSAEGKTEYLANYLMALQAGCLQRPVPGKVLGLNDTIFAPNAITIVDPLTLIKAPETKGMPGTTIAGIVGGCLALLLILSAITFICYRKRKNRRARADFEANRHHMMRHRHQSSISFQCQTHAMSPRFWPGGQEGAPEEHHGEVMIDVSKTAPQQAPGDLSRRSSLWKPHNSMSSFENTLDSTSEKTWESPYQDNSVTPKKGAMPSIKTSVSPAMPRTAHMSPSSNFGDVITPMSAESTRSTTALLPSIKPYVPAEHGVHNSPTPNGVSTFSSPVSGTTVSPLLRNGWPEPRPSPQQPQQPTPRSRLSSASNLNPSAIGVAVPIPPPPVPWIKTPGKKNKNNTATKNPSSTPKPTGVGAPVESWEVQTTFAMPPPPKR